MQNEPLASRVTTINIIRIRCRSNNHKFPLTIFLLHAITLPIHMYFFIRIILVHQNNLHKILC